ncbi:SSI family serine proteinase inhibitor [Microbispora sp. NBC_01189]|uniref:SSI family serine proteinase inhibitor n=1 Tax=Microbispora sp. NBC_01189 TaxID=2903583 RepID=UPI002E0DF2F8|nr:SSI family serine proteinase inhibitor [Microbispora sp. NBC_01189]
MRTLLVLLAGAALAAGPSGHASASGHGRAGVLPAPPSPEIALPAPPPPAARVRVAILTVANGAPTDPPARSAFLNCSPVGGSHPRPAEACARLSRAVLDPADLERPGTEPCTMLYAPATATASGIWDGKYFQLRHTFGNECEMRSATGALFGF